MKHSNFSAACNPDHPILFFRIMLFFLVSVTFSRAQVRVQSVVPSISKPGNVETAAVSFNDANILLDNHTIHQRYMEEEGFLTVKADKENSSRRTGIVQVFPWNSTVKLREIGFLIGFKDTKYEREGHYSLEIHELDSQTKAKIAKTISSFNLVIPVKVIQKGQYLSFRFEQAVSLSKGKHYAVRLYPDKSADQEINFQLAATHLLGSSFESAAMRVTSLQSEKPENDLNIYFLAE